MRYPPHLLKLISTLKKLPGIGSKSAERFAFHLVDWPVERLSEMSQIIGEVKQHLQNCPECGALIERVCPICSHEKRNRQLLCVVAMPKDIFSIEQTREFNGIYQALGGLLSPLHGTAPSSRALSTLKERIVRFQVREIILALEPTLEGDATALYIKKEISSLPVTISRLALGLPMGSSLDLIDEGTLARALTGRNTY